MSHTPGPYSVSSIPGNNHVMAKRHGKRFTVATVTGDPVVSETEFEANKALFAAAPDLLSACQRALSWLEIMSADKRHLKITPNDCVLAVQALTAALAKAKGETDMSDFITAGYDAQIAKLREQAAKAKGETAIERTAEDHARFSADMARIKAKGESK